MDVAAGREPLRIDAHDIDFGGNGVAWSLDGARELEVNLAALGPGGRVGDHAPGVDVLFVGLEGGLWISFAGRELSVGPGVLCFVPRDVPRRLRAPDGARYATVHRRRDEGLQIGTGRDGRGPGR